MNNLTITQEKIKITEICNQVNNNIIISIILIFILFFIYTKLNEYLYRKLEKKEITIKDYLRTIKYSKILFYTSIPFMYFIIYIKYIAQLE